LIIPTSRLEIEDSKAIDAPLFISNFKFLHDRVQEAAYGLIEEERKKAVHLKIGRLLLENTPPEELDEKLFVVIDHLNEGRELIVDPGQKMKTIRLNVMAGQKAKASNAYQSALKYLTMARDMLSANAWNEDYELTFEVHKEIAANLYLSGNFKQADQLYGQILKRTRSAEDKIKIYMLQMDHYQLEGRFSEAIQAQKNSLQLLGVIVPDSEEEVKEELDKVSDFFGSRKIMDMVKAPLMISSKNKQIMSLLGALFMSAYLNSDQRLIVWASVKMTNLSLQYGNSDISAYGYVNYAAVGCSGAVGRQRRP